MPRWYTQTRLLRGFVGAGLSAGAYEELCIDCHDAPPIGFALHANAEAGVELDVHSIFLRATLGGNAIIAHAEPIDHSFLPYAAITVGASF
jgi:hypothetical protein